jgi:hypothetical protein
MGIAFRRRPAPAVPRSRRLQLTRPLMMRLLFTTVATGQIESRARPVSNKRCKPIRHRRRIQGRVASAFTG